MIRNLTDTVAAALRQTELTGRYQHVAVGDDFDGLSESRKDYWRELARGAILALRRHDAEQDDEARNRVDLPGVDVD